MSTDKKLESPNGELIEAEEKAWDTHSLKAFVGDFHEWLRHYHKNGFLAGANYVKELASEQASKGFKVFAWSRGFYDTCTEGEMLLLEDCYQAATLSSRKRIEELGKKLEIAMSALERCKEIRRKDGNDNEYKGPGAIISEEALKKIKGEDA